MSSIAGATEWISAFIQCIDMSGEKRSLVKMGLAAIGDISFFISISVSPPLCGRRKKQNGKMRK